MRVQRTGASVRLDRPVTPLAEFPGFIVWLSLLAVATAVGLLGLAATPGAPEHLCALFHSRSGSKTRSAGAGLCNLRNLVQAPPLFGRNDTESAGSGRGTGEQAGGGDREGDSHTEGGPGQQLFSYWHGRTDECLEALRLQAAPLHLNTTKLLLDLGYVKPAAGGHRVEPPGDHCYVLMHFNGTALEALDDLSSKDRLRCYVNGPVVPERCVGGVN